MTHPYATIEYAHSLSHWGEAAFIDGWKTPVILRHINDTYMDAAGVYPFCVLSPEADIEAGLTRLKAMGVVSVVLVLDEFHRPDLENLSAYFTVLNEFKTHYIYRRSKGPIEYNTHHKRALRKAKEQVRADVLDLKKDWDKWKNLYDHIIGTMGLTGLHAFPANHHQALGDIEGLHAIGGWVGDELVSAHIWAGSGGMLHSHLVASNQKGYETRASFVVNDFSIQHFTDVEILNFGGGAGVASVEDDGLARFKSGFSNSTARSHICGAVLDQEKYDKLVATNPHFATTRFFPAYRAP